MKGLSLFFILQCFVGYALPISRSHQALGSLADSVLYRLDITKSNILWEGKSVRGSHTGNISLALGSVVVQGGTISKGYFEIDMNTIDCTDLKGTDKKDLDDHLKNEDFFEVDKFPKAYFSIVDVGAGQGGASHFVFTGNLTIKGITEEVRFSVEVIKTDDDTLTITSKRFTIDRDRWGVSYFGVTNMLIEDDIYLELSLVFSKGD